MTMTAEVQIPPEQVVPGVHPRWERPGLLALLAGTAALYLWGLGSGGWANSYYAAAAQAARVYLQNHPNGARRAEARAIAERAPKPDSKR